MIHKVNQPLHFCDLIIGELPLFAKRCKFTQTGILRPCQPLMHNCPKLFIRVRIEPIRRDF